MDIKGLETDFHQLCMLVIHFRSLGSLKRSNNNLFKKVRLYTQFTTQDLKNHARLAAYDNIV